ncbi:MAG: putative secretion system transrane protein 2 [Proteobacteria bacterium]|nr:putative secretion system transrane protein 2 [Pseudomonadota bacterium]
MARVSFVTLRNWPERGRWESMRLMRYLLRRFGWASLLAVVMALLAVVAWRQSEKVAEQLAGIRHAIREQATLPKPQVSDNRTRLKAFDGHLLAHDDIPAAVEEIMRLAENERLVFQRGEYKPEVDSRGGFMRYRMVLPVKGEAAAIRSFMHKALKAQKNLAVESVQFHREKIGTDIVEVRIHWLLLTRLPRDASTASKPAKGGA